MIWIFVFIIFLSAVFMVYKAYKLFISMKLLKSYGIYSQVDTSLELTKEYLKTVKHKDIDEIVFNDLELERVFKMIDHTYTEVGKEYMYTQIFKSDIDVSLLEHLISHWNDEKKLKKTLFELHHLNQQYSECLDLFDQMKNLHTRDIIFIILSFISLFIILGLGFLINTDILMYVFLWIALQMGLYSYYTKITNDIMSKTFSYCELVHTSDKLSRLNIYLDDDYKSMRTIINKAKKYTLLHRICAIIAKVDIFYLMEFIKGLFFIPYFQCFILKKHKNQLEMDLFSLYRYIGIVDVSLSIHGLRMNYDTCIPDETTFAMIKFKDSYHPLLKAPVKNSFDTSESCIITGTNASGKSTFLKMIGVNMVMARAIHTCFADEFTYYPFQLCSSIHMKDDLDSGDSYYVKEIKVMKHILDLSKDKTCLIFIDEILRGTNEKERIKISKAILSQLFKSLSITLVTTHDLDLVENFDNIQKYCFHDEVKENRLYCDYTIKKGLCRVGNAIKLLEVHGYDKAILDELKKPIM